MPGRVDDDLRKVIERFDSIVRPGREDDSENIYTENEVEKCEEWAAEDGIEIPRADAR